MKFKAFAFLSLLTIAVQGLFTLPAQGQFATGNLVVLRAGDGAAALSTAAATINLDQYNTTDLNQARGFSFTLPTSVNPISISGSATTEGTLTYNKANATVSLAGYAAAPGTLTVNSTASSSVARVGVNVDLTAPGTGGSSVSTTTKFSGASVRGAYSDGTNTWLVGAGTTGTGVVSFSPETIVSSTVTNIRTVNSFNGNLYFSTASGTTRGIYQVGTGLPTSSGTTSTNILDTGSSANSDAFAINTTGNVIYIADDRGAASGGGIQKWTFNGTTWTLAGTFNNLNLNEGARGLTVDFSGANPVLYATTTATSANKLVKLTDTGSNFATAADVLATAGTNTAFRGVILFAPVPEPTTILALSGVGLAAIGGLRKRFKRANQVS